MELKSTKSRFQKTKSCAINFLLPKGLIICSHLSLSKNKKNVSSFVGNDLTNILDKVLNLFVYAHNVHYWSVMKTDDQAQTVSAYSKPEVEARLFTNSP